MTLPIKHQKQKLSKQLKFSKISQLVEQLNHDKKEQKRTEKYRRKQKTTEKNRKEPKRTEKNRKKQKITEKNRKKHI